MCTLVALLAGGACSGDGAACWAAECKLDRLEFQRGGLTAMKPSKYPCTVFDDTIRAKGGPTPKVAGGHG